MRREARYWALSIAAYAVLVVGFTGGFVFHLHDRLPVPGQERMDGTTHWNAWHLQQCTNCQRTEHQFHPVGSSLALNANTPLPSWLAAQWPEPYTGFNVLLLANLLLTALGGYWYARFWLSNRLLAWLAGALVAFWLGRIVHWQVGHLNLLFLWPGLFALGALHRAWPHWPRKPRLNRRAVWWGVLFGVFAVLQSQHELVNLAHVLLYTALMVLVAVGWGVFRQRKAYWLIMALVGWFIAADQLTQFLKRSGVPDGATFEFSGGLGHYLLPHTSSAVYQWLLGNPNALPYHGPHWALFVGFALLGLLVWALVWRTRHRPGLLSANDTSPANAVPAVGWLALLAVLYTLPALGWDGEKQLYGPFSWMAFVPGWNENRVPPRFLDVGILPLVVFAFATLQTAFQHGRMPQSRQVAVTVLLGGLLLAEHFPSQLPSTQYQPAPEVYTWLAEQPGEGLLTIPVFVADGRRSVGTLNPEPILFQPVHGKRLVNGYISRMDDTTWAFFRQDSLLTHLARLYNGAETRTDPLPDSATAAAALKRLQIDWVLVQPHAIRTPAGAYVAQLMHLLRATEHRRGPYMVYQLPNFGP
jgi:cytochrome b561